MVGSVAVSVEDADAGVETDGVTGEGGLGREQRVEVVEERVGGLVAVREPPVIGDVRCRPPVLGDARPGLPSARGDRDRQGLPSSPVCAGREQLGP